MVLLKRAGRGELVLLCLLFLSGCAKFHPLPIDPPKVETEYRTRDLSDPGLRAYVEANSASKPSDWPPRVFDLETLTLVAFYFSPELDTARAHVKTTEAGIVTAGARPNPTVGTGGGYTDSPESPFLFRFTFDLPIETAGKRQYRIMRAERLTDAAQLALGETAWQVRARVRGALLDHLLAARELDLVRMEETVRSEAVALFERRLAVGEVSRPDVDTARTDLSNTRLRIRFLEGQVAETRTALAAALGLPVSSLHGVTFGWPNLERPPAEETVTPGEVHRAGLLNRLDVRRALAEYAAIEAALRLEIAKQYPDIRLVPGYAFDDAANKFTFIPSLILPIRNRNEGPIAEAEAQRKEAVARFLTLQARIIEETDRSLDRYRAALAEFSEADRTLRSLQDAREKAAQTAVEVGEMDRLTLVGFRLQSAAAARARLDALRRVQANLGALENAVQRPLGPAIPLPQVSVENPREKAKKDLP